MKEGFDNTLYVELQSKAIREKIKNFKKLYIEFGGKLFDDYHATRVLPGFLLDDKINMLKELSDDLEIIICINANDIEKNRIQTNYGITYDLYLLKTIDNFRNIGLTVNSVVITLYTGQKGVTEFQNKLHGYDIKTYIHTPTKGYPTDVDTIVSDEGYGANPYIETTKSIVIVTAPGASSGKLATCLSQMYHEYKKGIKAGYAKYETFPVWNLPLKHPVNVAYEAATANIKDINMIDSFHLEAYGKTAVNYNRDLEVFPIVKTILNKIMGKEIYKSPTDMGVNQIGFCIKDDQIVCEAANQEILRRYYRALNEIKLGISDKEPANRIAMLLSELDLSSSSRKVIAPCLEIYNTEKRHCATLQLPNGKIVHGKQSDLLNPIGALLLNALKELAKIPDDVDLLSPSILQPILKTKKKTSNNEESTLSLQELLVALSICSVTNPIVAKCLKYLDKLANCEAHASYMVLNGDAKILRNLKINITCESEFYSKKLFNEE